MNKTNTEQKAFPPSVAPGATIFLASVCVMMVEIVAGRLAARHIGSSLYTWTAVIDVILGGITLGYYLAARGIIGGLYSRHNPEQPCGRMDFSLAYGNGTTSAVSYRDCVFRSIDAYWGHQSRGSEDGP